MESAVASGDSGSLQSVQMQYIRSIVEDAMEDVREWVRRDIQTLHVNMLQEFEQQKVCCTFHLSCIS